LIVRCAQKIAWLLPALALLVVPARRAEPREDRPAPSGPSAGTSSDRKTATLAGTIFYQADTKRPWRQARYYVKEPAKGNLAEAVVALDGTELGKVPGPPRPATVVIDQKNFQFTPETVAIRAGDQVKFLNSDKDLHNVNAFHKLHSFNVNLPAGGEHTERFEHAGNIGRPYYLGCVYHGAMHGWVYVFDHPYFQVTAAEGRYRLENVPPGRYRLGMVHPAGQLRWSETIEVQAGQVIQKDIRVSPDNQVK
jgi:plastocyanin